MKKIIVIAIVAFALSFISSIVLPHTSLVATAGKPVPANDYARGLVYDGLEVSDTGECKGAFKVNLDASGKILCTHGPDPMPVTVKGEIAAPNLVQPITTTATPVVCDGDGTSGYRVQVLYVRPASVASQYTAYLNSFRQWAADADTEFVKSALETGGIRHVRFVTDQNCFPVVTEVTISDTGATTFGNTISALGAQGFNRNDRNYMIFMDGPRVYCGISNIQFDDSSAQYNLNNLGGSYGRIDNTCWSGVAAAHELTHNLGGVQFSAPHSDGNYHCIDGYDNMCDHGTSPLRTYTTCPSPAGDSLLDCNHDDYYHTNPPAGSYLATHWNVARNQFLIYSNQTAVRVDSIVTGKLNGSVFTATDIFKGGESVVVRVHTADTNGVNVSGATVSFAINQPNGSSQCVFTNKTTDTTGMVQGTCPLPPNATSGSWTGKVSTFTRSPSLINLADSVTQHTFAVENMPTAVTLSSFRAQPSMIVLDNSNTLGGALATFLGSIIILGVRKLLA